MRASRGDERSTVARLMAIVIAGGVLLMVPVLVQLVSARQGSVPSPLPAPGTVRWFADGETGDLSQWTSGQFGETVFNTGTGIAAPTQDVAHNGQWSLQLSIMDAAGETQAARILRWRDNPAEGYYSAWFYFPARYQPAVWWNVMQFKSGVQGSDPTWVVNVGNRSDGAMYLYLWDAIRERAYNRQLIPVDVPVGRWCELVVYYRHAQNRSGRITVWQDGVRLFDLERVQTATSSDLHWGLGNYTDDIDPPDSTIYVDDATIRAVESATFRE